MASTSVELPNVDIFDPIMCARRWAQCATQQEINVYLNKQIDVNRQVLTDTIKAQNEINAASKDKLANHETRISSLEQGLKDLDTAQQNLNAAFQQLQTDNNNFKSNVDLLLNQYQTTINLLQSNIDKISVSNEQLWNEVNKLKSQFDPDKLDAAIAGYEGVLAEAKKYTDQQTAALNESLSAVDADLQQQIKQLKADTEQWQFDKTNNDAQVSLNFNKQLTELRSDLMNEIAVIRGGFEAYRAHIDETVSTYHDYFEAENKRQDGVTAKLQQLVNDNELNNQAGHEQLNALIQEVATNAQANLDNVQSLLQSNIDDEVKSRLDGDAEINARINIIDSEIQALQSSDIRQWETINAILEAQNKINDKMIELEAYIKEQIADVTEQIRLAKIDIGNNSQNITQNGQEIASLNSKVNGLFELNGFKFRQTFFANGTNTYRYDVGYGFLNVATTTSQVSMSLELNAGVSGLVSVKATEYGRFQVISNTKYNIIENANQPNYAYGVIIGASSIAPIEFSVWYDPNTKIVTFVSDYPHTDSNTPNKGASPTTA